MVNIPENDHGRDRLRTMALAVGAHVAIVVGTVAALGVLSATVPGLASRVSGTHAVIVAAFAVVLSLRMRAARAGSSRALLAVGIIAAVLLLVNVIEAAIPGLFPLWMRVEMIGIAIVMVVVIFPSSENMSEPEQAPVRRALGPVSGWSRAPGTRPIGLRPARQSALERSPLGSAQSLLPPARRHRGPRDPRESAETPWSGDRRSLASSQQVRRLSGGLPGEVRADQGHPGQRA